MDLRYPIGKYEPQPFSDKQKREWLQDIQFLPGMLESAIENLDEKQLLTPYREGGWNVKQVVHHVADAFQHNERCAVDQLRQRTRVDVRRNRDIAITGDDDGRRVDAGVASDLAGDEAVQPGNIMGIGEEGLGPQHQRETGPRRIIGRG